MGKEWGNESGNVEQYLTQKMQLYGNYDQNLASHKGVQEIMLDYMQQNVSGEPSDAVRAETKAQLIAYGIYDDQELLEFLLLIAEKPRYMADRPRGASDIALGNYFFNQYRSSREHWSDKVFYFSLHHSRSHQRARNTFIEEVAIEMINHSRASFARSMEPTRLQRQWISRAENLFQRGFYDVFRIEAPLSIAEATHINEYSNHADRIGRRTFLEMHEDDRPYQFVYLAIHEALHLCFPGFHQNILEEAFIETIIWNINERSDGYELFFPVTEAYIDFRDSLMRIFQIVPRLQNEFMAYVIHGDREVLQQKAGRLLTRSAQRTIDQNARGADGMMLDALNRFVRGAVQ